jgi:ABC-type bacteriocin/lantibiotic exporter with double-glycine peptidase domain
MGSAEPQDGQILNNQLPLRSSQIFRNYQIAYLPQSPTALDYSLLNNITLAFVDNEAVDESRLKSAIISAGLDEFIEALPDGLNTTLGEFGSRVSGGQLQRIALARALYRKPRVLLLDEATSSLDFETEAKILKDLINLKDQTLIILVSHSSHVAQYADKLLEL